MSRIAIPALDETPTAARPVLDAVRKQLGSVPNLFRLVAQSPAVLQGYTGLSSALAKALDLRLRERIAIAVAQQNGCDYCLSAHSYIGTAMAKLDAAEVAAARHGASSDPKADAAVKFAVRVVQTAGRVSDADLVAVRAAGFTDAQVIEIVAVAAENVLTNLVNNVARTDIDFPVLHTDQAA